MAEKKLSKKTLSKSFRNWAYGNLTCFSQEHMQTFGYLCAMLPIVEELYEDKEQQKEALQTYSAFFNTEPQIGTMVVGITAGLEEARANGEPVDDDAINGIRAGLMGPLAGLGDSLIVGTLIPILLGIALGLSTGGSPLGAIFYIVVWNALMYFGMKFAYNSGYELGGKAVEALVGPRPRPCASPSSWSAPWLSAPLPQPGFPSPAAPTSPCPVVARSRIRLTACTPSSCRCCSPSSAGT